MNLKNKTAIVAGGTGNIGVGIVKQFLEDGASVIVPYRNETKLHALKDYAGAALLANLIPMKADLSSFDAAMEINKTLTKENRKIDIAVASLGGWWQGGQLTEVSGKDYETVMNENVHSHFYFARAVSPLLKKQKFGVYVAINGPGGIYARPGTELVAVAGWMQFKMTEFLNDELRAAGSKAYQLIIAGIHTRQHGRYASPEMITPEEIGTHIGKLYTGDVAEPDKLAQTFFRVKLPWFKL
jgi:NAD(P)-dependent dehydrogenase (short-subunit alcohol dehydrogenase family)